MSVFDKILEQYNYKFEDGYPDFTKKSDRIIMTEILKGILIEKPSPTSEKGIELLSNELGVEIEQFKELTPNKFKVLMPNSERSEFINKAKSIDGFEHELKGGSRGQLRYDDKTIFQPKPENVQGNNSAGKENEGIFIDSVNAAIEENGGKIDIRLNSKNTTETFKDIIRVEDSSKGGASKGDKSDAQFFDSRGVVANISLKKDGGFRWATLRTTFPNFLKTIIQKGMDGEIPTLGFKPDPRGIDKFLMWNPQTDDRVTLVVIEDMPMEAEESIVFGPETPKVIVVGKTFTANDFNVNGGVLDIECSTIYKSMKDVEDANAEPTIVLAQHIGQKWGIDFRAYPKFMTKMGDRHRGIRLNYKDII